MKVAARFRDTGLATHLSTRPLRIAGPLEWQSRWLLALLCSAVLLWRR